MPPLRRYRVYATAKHCAVTEVVAGSADEAAAIAGELQVDQFDILHVQDESVKIEKVILVLDTEHTEDDDPALNTPVH